MNEVLKNRSEDVDWDNRTLCSDGNCIGVIGPDGRCNECGRSGADLELSEAAGPRVDKTPPAGLPAQDHAAASSGETIDPPPGDEDGDWDDRTLCGDGNCIGVIGSDGRCSECGKPVSDASQGS